mmetsp:Transcript_12140/g.28804  ORF Transcript_12140/g.28804 Transcript_12140/m.28804 type:complete len:205 (-) Transcript_12140:109-723(-)
MPEVRLDGPRPRELHAQGKHQVERPKAPPERRLGHHGGAGSAGRPGRGPRDELPVVRRRRHPGGLPEALQAGPARRPTSGHGGRRCRHGQTRGGADRPREPPPHDDGRRGHEEDLPKALLLLPELGGEAHQEGRRGLLLQQIDESVLLDGDDDDEAASLVTPRGIGKTGEPLRGGSSQPGRPGRMKRGGDGDDFRIRRERRRQR